jgi:hypothetical protein
MTPGPWKLHAWGDSAFEIYSDHEDGNICEVPSHEESSGVVSEANAILIVAAPDMLQGLHAAVIQIESLRRSVRHASHCMAPKAFPCSCDADRLYEDSSKSIDAIRDIISKATAKVAV